MDKYSDLFAEILFSLERINNTLREVAGKDPQSCGFSSWNVPAIEESLPLVATQLDGINESLTEIFFEENESDDNA